MHYLVENNYTRRLYQQLKIQSNKFEIISRSELDLLSETDTLIIDESDLNFIETVITSKEQVIVLGESITPYKCISKYQSYRNIQAQLSNAKLPIYLFTSESNIECSDIFFKSLATQLGIEYIVSLNYVPNSNFSLYQWSIDSSIEIPKHTIIDLISSVPDIFNSPVEEILGFVDAVSLKSSVLIISYPLKSCLDKKLLEIANTVFLVTSNFESDYPTRIKQFTNATIYSFPYNIQESKPHKNNSNFFEGNLLKNIEKMQGVK